MNKRKYIIIIIVISMIGIFVFHQNKIVIRLGVFSGSYWDVPSSENYKIIDNAIERFEERYPYITVEYQSGILKEDYSQWLSEQIVQGKEPDVFVVLGEDFNMLSSLGALNNLNSFANKDKEFDIQKFYTSSYEAGIYQDNQYALPFESNPQIMLVNKTILKDEGIDIPSDHWTLDDFMEICEKVTKDTNNDGVVDQFGCYNYNWLDSFYGHNISIFNEAGTQCNLVQDNVKESIRFIQKLNDLNQQHVITSEEFIQGQVAFSPMTFAQYKVYKPYPWKVKKYSNFEWDCIKMPSLDGEESFGQIPSLLMGMSSRTSYSKEAWEFLKVLTYDEETQIDLTAYSQGVSPLKDVIEYHETPEEQSDLNNEINIELLKEVMEEKTAHNRFKNYESALTILDTRMNQLMESGEDIDLSLMELQREMNLFLND